MSTRRVDVDQGRGGRVEVRSRLAARVKPKWERGRLDLFASMPPWETKHLLFRMAAELTNWCDDEHVLVFIDVPKAHLNGRLEKDEWAFIEILSEAGGGVGRLRRRLYGMTNAASAWDKDYTDRLEAAGFKRGKSAPSVLYNSEWETRCVVHGGDFMFLCPRRFKDRVVGTMEEWYEIKLRAVVGKALEDRRR